MPAVNIRLRWPNGQETNTYSPSTTIYQYLEAGKAYPITEFMRLAEDGLNAASERVKEVKGFYCSSAMDSLSGLKLLAKGFAGLGSAVEVLEIKNQAAGQVSYASFGDL